MSKVGTITIGMPVYNAEPWLHQTITALVEQTHRNFVLVISDNASADATGRICEAFARNDARISYHRNDRNIGVFRNYEKVLRSCNTPYFKWASANDICAPTFLEHCLASLEANPAAVLAYPRTIVFTDEPDRGQEYPHDPDIRDRSPVVRFTRVLSELRLNNAFNGLIRSDALRKTASNMVYQRSDIVLLAGLALRGEIMRLPQYLFFRRLSPQAASALKNAGDLRKFFSAEGRDVLGMPTWDFHWHCLKAALNAPIALTGRMQCAAYAARGLWWNREAVWHEASLKMTGALAKTTRSSTL